MTGTFLMIFFAGVLIGGYCGYRWGATVKQDVLEELERLRSKL